MDEIVKTIRDNYLGRNNTFIGELREEGTFSLEGFKKYLKSILEFSEEKYQDLRTDEITYMIIRTYTYALRSFLYHHHKYDCYEIVNNPSEDKVTNFVEGMRVVIEDCYLNGSKVNWMDLEIE